MSPRALITTIGATALAFGAVVGSAAVAPPHAFAQETPPAAQADDPRAAFEAERAERYQAFVAALAADLGSDAAAVDAAIRDALKQEIADALAAGDISDEEAAARTAVIDVADAPLGLGHGHGPGHGFGGRGFDGPGRGGRGGDRGFGPRDGGPRDDAAVGGPLVPGSIDDAPADAATPATGGADDAGAGTDAEAEAADA